MKHISTFKLFESYESIDPDYESLDEIREYLEDIFRELEDIGFTCRIDILRDRVNTYEEHWFKVHINYNSKRFKWSMVEDYVESATDYMDSVGYYIGQTKEWNRFSLSWKNVELHKSFEIDEELSIVYELNSK